MRRPANPLAKSTVSPTMNREWQLRCRIRWLTWLFIAGLVLSGATALPLESELDWLVRVNHLESLARAPNFTEAPAWAVWLLQVREAIRETNAKFPFLAYGTDWLAFGHFAIAIAFVGALRDPVRNCWLFTFGIIACALVVPYALLFGAIRGIPFWWRLIDCCFGLFGIIPVWLCKKWSRELQASLQLTA